MSHLRSLEIHGMNVSDINDDDADIARLNSHIHKLQFFAMNLSFPDQDVRRKKPKKKKESDGKHSVKTQQ